MRTAFTGDEWREFVEGFEDPNEAFEVANFMWERERHRDLSRVADFCTDPIAKDLLQAAFALISTSSSIFHEIEERLLSHLYETSEEYREEIESRRIEAAEQRHFGF